MGQRLLEELDRRLGSAEAAADLPGTLLMKLTQDYVNYLNRKQKAEEELLAQEKVDPLTMVYQPGLSLERRVLLMSEYVEEVEDVWRRGSAILAELLEEVEHGNGSEMSKLPNVVS